MYFVNNEEYDVFNVDDNIKSSLSYKSDSQIIRVLNTPIVFAFNRFSNIDDLLAGNYIDQVLYAVVDDKVINSIYLIDDFGESTIVENSLLSGDNKTVHALLNNVVLDYLPEGVEIFNVYYFWGQSNHQGSALYYRTNEGGYVYYRSYLNNDSQYLFPEEDFFDYMKSLYSTLGPDNPPGDIEIKSTWDLSKYEITSGPTEIKQSAILNKTMPFFYIGIILALTMLSTFFIVGSIFIKRRKNNESQ